MSDFLYSPATLAAEVKASEASAATRPAKRVNEAAGDLQVTRSIPQKLYMNAVVGHGVDPNDHEYWSDMERYVPSIKVQNESSRLFFGPLARYEGVVPRRNRFGKVTFHKRYA